MIQNSWTKAEKYAMLLFVAGSVFLDISINVDIIFTGVIGQNSLDSLLCYAVFFFLLLRYWKTHGCVIHIRPVITLMIVALIMFLDRFRTNQISVIRSNITDLFIARCLIAILVSAIPLSSSQLYTSLKMIGFVCYFTAMFIPFMPSNILALYDDAQYGASMLFGQHMTVGVIIMMFLSIHEKRKMYYFLTFAGAAEILVLGNRGSVAGILLFVLLYAILFIHDARVIVIGAIVAVLYLVITSSAGIRFISSLLGSLGLASRNLTKLLDATLTATGREHIYAYYQEIIRNNWLFGVGISYSWSYGYPHQFFYEVWTQYGGILGSLAILVFAFESLKVALNKVDRLAGEMYCVFFAIGFFPLLFSGSYWTFPWFWTMIGALFIVKRIIKKERLTMREIGKSSGTQIIHER